MKKTIKLLSIAFLAGAMFMSCEGPAGADGLDGADGTAVCMTCHNAGTVYAAKVDQFNESAHSLGTYYSRAGECSGCHSTDGFLARMDFTSASDIYDLALTDQSQISCKTCHMVHAAYDSTDWALTFTDQVTESLFGTKSPEHTSYSFDDMGDANMCLQCHQSRDRGNVPSITSTANVSISTHWGPHYGIQGNLIHSKGGIEVSGTETYPTATVKHDCILCHMDGGDHTFAAVSCNKCHGSMDETVKTTQDEVHDRLFALGKSLTELGVMIADTESEWIWDDVNGVHVEKIDTVGYHPAGGYGGVDVSADKARAVWNYMTVYQDHSYGAHNPGYILALLKNTQAMVDGL